MWSVRAIAGCATITAVHTAIVCWRRQVSRSSVLNTMFTSIKRRRGRARANRTDFAYCISSPRAARTRLVRASSCMCFHESAEDLPDHRKEAGFEELDFALEDYGGRYGGDCFAGS